MQKNNEDDFLLYRKKVLTEYPSMRDQFMMASLTSLIDRFYLKEGAVNVSLRAYQLADILLKARAVTQKAKEIQNDSATKN